MISKDEIKKLATLSRLALTEGEMDKFGSEIDSILGFVARVKEAAEAAPMPTHPSVNTFRDDVVIHESGKYGEDLLKAAPARDGGYVKVKKILE